MCGGAPPGTSWAAYAAPSGAGAPGRAQALKGLAQTCTLEGSIELPGVTDADAGARAESRVTDAAGEVEARLACGYEQSVLLLASCREAIRLGISRVVWPIHLGGDMNRGAEAPTSEALHQIADACDRAMLASQLANIDAGRASQGVVIELPYVDFSDAQVMELAIDMGVPLSACWWCKGEGSVACGTCGECVRWQRALTAVSPGATLVQVVASRRQQRAEK